MCYTYLTMKKCYKCGESKEPSEFYRDKTRPDLLSTKCKDCAKAFKAKNFRTKAEKFCARCQNTMPTESFDLSSRGDGYQTACKTCRNLVKVISLYEGMTWQKYHDMLSNQNGQCKICGNYAPLQIDHDHKTEKVRGLICGPCNRGLGHFRDSPEVMLKAIDYLRGAN